MQWVHYIILSGYSVTSICHVLGLFLLFKTKYSLPNQRLTIINLSMTELLTSIKHVVVTALFASGINSSALTFINNFLDISLVTLIRLVVLYIIVDRFLHIYLNIKYTLYISPKKLKCIICIMWVFSWCFGITWTLIIWCKLVSMHNIKFILANVLLFGDIMIISSAIVTYVHLYLRVRNINESTNSRGSTGVKTLFNNFGVPCLMVLTYILFNISATVMRVFREYDIPYVLDIIGFLSDSLIYVFLQKRMRHMLKKLLNMSNDKTASVELKILRSKSMANQTSCMLVKHKD